MVITTAPKQTNVLSVTLPCFINVYYVWLTSPRVVAAPTHAYKQNNWLL